MIAISICLSDLPKGKMSTAKNNKVYIDLIVAEKKEVDQYGKTHTVYVSQTKEEREAKTDKVYVGNGKAIGQQSAAPQPQKAKTPAAADITEPLDDLPF